MRLFIVAQYYIHLMRIKEKGTFMKITQYLVLLLTFQVANVNARLHRHINECSGWRTIERTEDYEIVEHRHHNGCCQTIQITNNGNIFFLLPGPYGYDQYILDMILPKSFPQRYRKRCCWLRKTKDGKRLVMTYQAEEPELLIDLG